jgi:toxin-antitoxin system PIN domain toxin
LIAVDTNLLVYAHREDSLWHERAYLAIAELAGGREPWGIPWPCVHEFLAIVTHPRIFDPPSDGAAAIAQVEAWQESPTLMLLGESKGYWPHLANELERSRVTGPRTHDARVAALCRFHKVGELWTADRDLSRFAGLRVRNPLVS